MDPLAGNLHFPETPPKLDFQPFGLCHQPTPCLKQCKTPSSSDWSLDISLTKHTCQSRSAQIKPSHASTLDQKREGNLLSLLFSAISACSSWVMFLFLIALWVLPLEICLHLVSLAAEKALAGTHATGFPCLQLPMQFIPRLANCQL